MKKWFRRRLGVVPGRTALQRIPHGPIRGIRAARGGPAEGRAAGRRNRRRGIARRANGHVRAGSGCNGGSAENAAGHGHFEAQRAINPETAGRLNCAGTPISCPVACTGSDTYYLNHLINGEASRSGALFIGRRRGTDFPAPTPSSAGAT
jgi:Uncharacterized protein conserved in bacteria